MALIGLDIGHGSDTFPPSKGTYKSGKGYAEHDFNAKLGMEIKKLLEAQSHTVILGQQPNKKDVALRTRTNLYNRKKVDLVISIHANANASSSVNGRCAFYWGTSSQSKSLAQSIIKEIKAKGYSTHGNGLHAGKRGSWTNLHINRETQMPAVLVEHGFMTGNKDFELIFGSKQDEYIKDMAEADVRGIQAYLGESFKGDPKDKPGWKKNKTGWWYLDYKGNYPKNQWKRISGTWYHFNNRGYMQTGWLKDKGRWYYLDKSGAMQKGFVQVDGKTYFMNLAGRMTEDQDLTFTAAKSGELTLKK